MKLIRKLLWMCFLLAIAVTLIALGYYFAVTKDTALREDKLLLNDSQITIYSAEHTAIGNDNGFLSKQTVPLQEISTLTKRAFIDTEDKRFFTHGGFDIKRIAKAAWNNIKAKAFKEGASTISQQLIKNTHLSQEKTLKRKLCEWKLTRALERKYTKDEILEKYLNTIYFGHNCFGLRAACAFYFNKTPKELTLSESAILAGIVKSPNNYSPFKNPEACAKRRATVLALMETNGSITHAQKQCALQEPLPINLGNDRSKQGYLNFVFDELTDLVEKQNLTLGGKIEITTYLVPHIQAQLEKQSAPLSNVDKTLMVLDLENDGFKGCVSTVGNIRRSPASLIKPLLVYAPAIEENLISPATPILDEKVNYNGYQPENYDKQFHGYVSTRDSIAKSYNIPAVKTLHALGISKGVSYLSKMNFCIPHEDENLALALGGMKNGLYFKDIISAYATFENEGTYTNGAFIKEIKINGKCVYQRKKQNKQVFSKETAYLMSDMLKSAAKTGTAKKLRTLPFDIAAKTGTTGTKQGNTDAYALSYTTKDCVGVWIGNSDNSYIDHTGGGLPCDVIYHINKYLYEDYKANNTTITPFKKPNDVVEAYIDKIAYYDTHTILLADDISPIEYRQKELFKRAALPAKKSEIFSNPAIFTPTLSVKDNAVIISFDQPLPQFYTYRIDRYDYATHTTLHDGTLATAFTDDSIEKNRTYVYTVTPIYKQNVGISVTLPTVTTKDGKPPSVLYNDIVNKDWWEY